LKRPPFLIRSLFFSATAPPSRRTVRLAPSSLAATALLAAVGLAYPTRPLLVSPLGERPLATLPSAIVSPAAFGRSGAVQVRFILPGDPVQYPLRIDGDPTALAYEWQRLSDSVRVDTIRPLSSDTLIAPSEPGFYQLALVRSGARQIVTDLTLAVLVPFEEKRGATLDGYHMGTYIAEHVNSRDHDRPEGFVQVFPEMADLPLTKHLSLGDFLTQDDQTTWPRYAAVSSRVLDKLELVMAEVMKWRGSGTEYGTRPGRTLVQVQSAYRTPWHNHSILRAARDSRHQYGDAVDVAIDADGDGRLTREDLRLVELAVEIVESQYPDLVGGMGLYASGHLSHPYVHIDARGTRVRWRA
jgi:hypothetical protein